MQNAPKGAFCNTFDLHLATSCHKDLCLSIFKWPFYTGFTVWFLFSQAKEPKDVISLDEINAAFVPEKLGNPNGLQITYMKNGVTRNIFVYCDNSQVRCVVSVGFWLTK